MAIAALKPIPGSFIVRKHMRHHFEQLPNAKRVKQTGQACFWERKRTTAV
jgi:hypothetical protein